MRKVAIIGLALAAAPSLTAAAMGQATGQAPSQMDVGVQPPPPPPQQQPTWLDSLSPVDRQRVLEIEQARRGVRRRGTSIDCRAEQAARPMSDLERAAQDLKCSGQ